MHSWCCLALISSSLCRPIITMHASESRETSITGPRNIEQWTCLHALRLRSNALCDYMYGVMWSCNMWYLAKHCDVVPCALKLVVLFRERVSRYCYELFNGFCHALKSVCETSISSTTASAAAVRAELQWLLATTAAEAVSVGIYVGRPCCLYDVSWLDNTFYLACVSKPCAPILRNRSVSAEDHHVNDLTRRVSYSANARSYMITSSNVQSARSRSIKKLFYSIDLFFRTSESSVCIVLTLSVLWVCFYHLFPS